MFVVVVEVDGLHCMAVYHGFGTLGLEIGPTWTPT